MAKEGFGLVHMGLSRQACARHWSTPLCTRRLPMFPVEEPVHIASPLCGVTPYSACPLISQRVGKKHYKIEL